MRSMSVSKVLLTDRFFLFNDLCSIFAFSPGLVCSASIFYFDVHRVGVGEGEGGSTDIISRFTKTFNFSLALRVFLTCNQK